MKLLKASALGTLLLTMLAGCNNFEPSYDTIENVTYNGCYSIVTDTKTGQVSVSTPVSFGMNLNYTKLTTEASVSGMYLNGEIMPVLTLKDIDWNANTYWYFTTTTNPTASLTTGAKPTVTNFKAQWNPRADIPNLGQNEGYPLLAFGFTMDNQYRVESSIAPFYMWGKTTASSASSEPFTGDVNKIVATPDFENMTMTVLVNGAKFADRMPPLNIELENIPLTFVDNGATFSFEASELTPSIGGTPYPDYKCTKIKGTLNPVEGMTFEFTCDVPRMGQYVVKTTPTVFGYRE